MHFIAAAARFGGYPVVAGGLHGGMVTCCLGVVTLEGYSVGLQSDVGCRMMLMMVYLPREYVGVEGN